MKIKISGIYGGEIDGLRARVEGPFPSWDDVLALSQDVKELLQSNRDWTVKVMARSHGNVLNKWGAAKKCNEIASSVAVRKDRIACKPEDVEAIVRSYDLVRDGFKETVLWLLGSKNPLSLGDAIVISDELIKIGASPILNIRMEFDWPIGQIMQKARWAFWYLGPPANNEFSDFEGVDFYMWGFYPDPLKMDVRIPASKAPEPPSVGVELIEAWVRSRST